MLLILILGAGLFMGYKYVKAQEEAQDAELLNVYTQHQLEQNAAKQASYDDLYAFYQADLDAVAQYLPGIVCWGDDLTAGSAGGVSYPDTLQQLIDAAIVDKYNFRGTLDKPEQYSRIEKWEDFSVDIPVVNMGAGKENTDTVLGRNGAVPFVTKADFIIPADTEPVQIEFISASGAEVAPLTQGDNGVNNVFINGIEGKLSLDLESYKSYHTNIYFFTRKNPGAEIPVSAGTEIKTSAAGSYRDYIPVIFTGTYDDTLLGTVEELIAKQKQLIAHQVGDSDRYIILGLYYMDGRADRGYYGELEKYEAAMLQEYGNHYINVRKYMCSDGLSDAGITPTKDDTYDVSHGHVPASLRSAADESELNAQGYKLLGQIVFDRMDKLGYFDEVKDELGITALEKLEKQEAAKAELTAK